MPEMLLGEHGIGEGALLSESNTSAKQSDLG
jgi:hypothetical protein